MESGPDSEARPQPTPPGRRQWVKMALGAAAIAVVAALAFVGGRYVRRGERAAYPTELGPGSRLPQPRLPLQIRLAGGEALEVSARGHRDNSFRLPPPARECVVTERIVGVSGGGKDFEVPLPTDDDYLNRSTNHAFRSVWKSGTVTVQSLEQHVRAPGLYHLVVSNAFSLLTRKVVMVSANVFCPDST